MFNDYPNIAGLFLSEVLFHEIGHHAEQFKRHKIKKPERFANKYAKAGYYNYLKVHRTAILRAYKMAGLNIFKFNRKDRKKFRRARNELIGWIEDHRNGVSFP